jgi:hypothetical protein
MSKKDASNKTARRILGWGDDAKSLFSHSASMDEAGRTIAGWRERIKKGKRQEDHAASVYYSALVRVRELVSGGQSNGSSVTLQTGAEALLKAPPNWIKSESPKEIE